MTPEQANQIIFIALLSIPSLIVLGGVIYVAITVMPTILRQMQQLIDNNSQLTKITGQTETVLSSIQPELVKQTNSIDKQTAKIEVTNEEIKGQRADIKGYNTLVMETVENHANHMEANTASMARFEAAMIRFENTVNALPEQLQLMIDDKFKCNELLRSYSALESYVKQIVFQQQRKATGQFPTVPIPTTVPNESGS